MAHYYGVTRSEEYLAHYGIRGMRWGVRKAIKSGNDKRLARLYNKSQKKLQKLNLRADSDIQKEYAKRHAKRAIVAASVGTLGLTSYGLQMNAAKKVLDSVKTGSSSLPRQRKKKIVSSGKGVHKVGEGLNTGLPGNNGFVYPNGQWTDMNGYNHFGSPEYASTVNYKHPAFAPQAKGATNGISKAKVAKGIALGVGIAGMGTAAYQTGKAIASKYRTTKRGHAKAVAKRNKFKYEMNSAFAGTKYGKKKYR